MTPIIIPMRTGSIGGGYCRMPDTALEYYTAWVICVLLCLAILIGGITVIKEGEDIVEFILGLLLLALIPFIISQAIIGCLINGI